jgi:acyl-[acyl-carrier-protein] desaturase
VAAALLTDLEPVVAQLYDRHMAQSKEWFPHELVPWSRGRDYIPGETWDEAQAQLPSDVRSSLFVNLLTEDNLPYYSRTISAVFGRQSAWGAWVHRWTSEEGRHAIVIRDYLSVTRAIDPVVLERARMAQVMCAAVPEPSTPEDGLVYVALQELATRSRTSTPGACSSNTTPPATRSCSGSRPTRTTTTSSTATSAPRRSSSIPR